MGGKRGKYNKYKKISRSQEVLGLYRPKIEIDWAKVEILLHAHCTIKEIAGFFDCSEDVFYSRFEEGMGLPYKEWAERRRYKGDALLRNKQYQEAMQGNTRMLVLLGKERLGQTDRQEQIITQKTAQKTILELPDNGNRSQNQATGWPTDTIFQD